MDRRMLSLTLVTGSLLLVAALIAGAGCLRESEVTVTGITVGAEKVTGSDVILNVTTDIQNTYGVSAGSSRVRLAAYDTASGLLIAEQTGDAGFLGIRGSGSVSSVIVLPRKGSYRLVSTVFENNQRKGQGEITVYNLDQLTPDTQETGLSISDIDFQVRKVAGDRVTIGTDIYFTNTNNVPTSPYTVEVKAKEEDARLLADKQRTELGVVGPGATVIAGITLTVPDQYNYLVDVAVWKNDTIVLRGEGAVRLRPGMQVAKDSAFVTRQIETSKFVAETGTAAAPPQPYATQRSPGFGGLPGLAGVALAVGVLAARRRT